MITNNDVTEGVITVPRRLKAAVLLWTSRCEHSAYRRHPRPRPMSQRHWAAGTSLTGTGSARL